MNKHMPCIILVRPQMGENIGAAARGMMNFGLEELRLVAPRDGWPNAAAMNMSAGALEKMPDVQIFDDLAGALSDCHHIYATTARRRDMVKPVVDAGQAADETHKKTSAGLKTAFVFGPERTGLENDEIALCHEILSLPVNPDFPSINLAQAVLITGYE